MNFIKKNNYLCLKHLNQKKVKLKQNQFSVLVTYKN